MSNMNKETAPNRARFLAFWSNPSLLFSQFLGNPFKLRQRGP